MERHNEWRRGPTQQIDLREGEKLLIGRAIVERIRKEANVEDGYFGTTEADEDLFRELYLTERHAAVPERILSDEYGGIEQDIRSIFALVFDGVRTELDLRMGREESHWLYVDAAMDDHTTAILCTSESVLSLYSCKPWAFTWEDDEMMANDLGETYEAAAERLLAERQRRATTYRTTKT